MTKNLLRISLALLFVLFSHSSFAFSAIAAVKGHFKGTWGYASNYDTQKEADKQALISCKEAANANGFQKIANQCKVLAQGKYPGYGAIVCGEEGCSWGIGYETSQEAINAAYGNCSKNYSNCQEKDIQFYKDFAGFTPAPSQNSANDCRPRSNSLRCSSSCSNGDCIVTYENGCKMRVQVQPRFNGFTNTWEYPSPNC